MALAYSTHAIYGSYRFLNAKLVTDGLHLYAVFYLALTGRLQRIKCYNEFMAGPLPVPY